jgi:tRNA threonylcarbamoyladenosine biosynthesis protein TsaE
VSEFNFESAERTREWVHATLSPLVFNHSTPRVVLLLEGEMGAGKTQIVHWLLESVGSKGEVCSPTYAVHNHYEVDHFSVDHLDLYRLESEEDLESTGFWDLFGQASGIIVLEWADRLEEGALPPNWMRLQIRIQKGYRETRQVYLSKI